MRLRLVADDFIVGSGFDVSYEAIDDPEPPRELTGGEIAGIVIGAVAGVLLVGLGAYCLATTLARRKREAEARREAELSAEALTWTREQAIEAVPESVIDEPSPAAVERLQQSAAMLDVKLGGKHALLFGREDGQRTPVNVELRDSVLLSNHGKTPVRYEISLPACEHTYALSARPGVGTLAAGEERRVALTLTLNYTTNVSRWLRVAFVEPAGEVLLPLRLEGEPSTRLDPDAVELYGDVLGDGAFGTVFRGRYRGTAVACKVPKNQTKLLPEQLAAFEQEIVLFEKLRNPYIVNFVGGSLVPGKLCLCTELLERGTVFALLHKAHLALVLKYKIALDAANALAFLHKSGVLYRDLKPNNMLVFSVSHNANVNAKLSDFGTAITVQDPFKPTAQRDGSVGTPAYMAPEAMSDSPVTAAMDVYSWAMFTYELLAEKAPFHSLKRVWDLPALVLDGLRPELDSEWNNKVSALISDAWLHKAERRPPATELVERITAIYQKERKRYEKTRRDKKSAAASASPAQTGDLQDLLDVRPKQVDAMVGAE